MHGLRERLQNISMQILKSGCSESAHKVSAYQVVLFIHMWCETTEGFIDSHFDVKVFNVFSVAMGLIILILLRAALPLICIPRKKSFQKKFSTYLP